MNSMSYPPTRREPVVKTVGAVTFEDPYHWLATDSPEALEWQWRQDEIAQGAVRQWPHFDELLASINDAGEATTAFERSAPRLFAGRWFWAAPSERSKLRTLWMGETPETGRPLVESGILADKPDDRESAAVNGFEPSPDAKYVAMAITVQGAMVGDWRVVEVESGRILDVREPAAPYTGALPGWTPDGSGFYLHDRTVDGKHRIRFVPVRAGTAARPEVVFDDADVPANVSGLTPAVSPSGRWVIALAGPHERIAYMIGDTHSNTWRRFLPHGYDGECEGDWLDGDTYLARAHDGERPRGRLVAIPVSTSTDLSSWREIEPQSEAVLRAVAVQSGRIVICDLWHVSARFRTLSLDGRDEVVIPLEMPGSSMVAFIMRRFERSEALAFDYMTFTRRPALYRYDAEGRKVSVIGHAPEAIPNIQVTQRFARSLDGTRVPYFLVHRKDLDLRTPHPTLITGYGGFNVALLPMYLAHLRPFVEAGGVFIHTNLRGGGEYGKHWHDTGRLASKWNVFLDLFAVAEQLIADGITASSKLALTGASNGGLLAGAAIAHRPDLFRVVAPVVPLFDQLEPLPEDPASAAILAVFLEDYGDPRDPVMSKVLYSYSPYHNIRQGVAYPAVFQVFGEKDLGCMPFHGRKFTAALQGASTSGRPVMLRVWRNTGHSAMGAQGRLQAAEWLAFVMRELDMRPVARGKAT